MRIFWNKNAKFTSASKLGAPGNWQLVKVSYGKSGSDNGMHHKDDD